MRKFYQGFLFELTKGAIAVPIVGTSLVAPLASKLRSSTTHAVQAIRRSVPTKSKGYIHPAG